jgi:hypothetical protein
MHFPSAQKVALRVARVRTAPGIMNFIGRSHVVHTSIASTWHLEHPYFNCSIDDLRSRSTIWIQCMTFGCSHGDYAVIFGLASNQVGSTFGLSFHLIRSNVEASTAMSTRPKVVQPPSLVKALRRMSFDARKNMCPSFILFACAFLRARL